MIANDDGRFLKIFVIWIADGKFDTWDAVPQSDEPGEIPKHVMNAKTFFLQIPDCQHAKHCSRGNNEKDGNDKEK